MGFRFTVFVLGLALASCSNFSVLKDESSDGSAAKKSSVGVGDPLDPSDPVGSGSHSGGECTPGDKMKDVCNTCSCSEDGLWGCTEMECQPGDPADPGDPANGGEDCDAEGITWRFANGVCTLSAWSGCGPGEGAFDTQLACLEANNLKPALQYLPKDSCQKFPLPSQTFEWNEACREGVVSGSTCAGNGGPQCQNEKCKDEDLAACVSGGVTLVCRPVDFTCN